MMCECPDNVQRIRQMVVQWRTKRYTIHIHHKSVYHIQFVHSVSDIYDYYSDGVGLSIMDFRIENTCSGKTSAVLIYNTIIFDVYNMKGLLVASAVV